jgi:hypothetical protein
VQGVILQTRAAMPEYHSFPARVHFWHLLNWNREFAAADVYLSHPCNGEAGKRKFMFRFFEVRCCEEPCIHLVLFDMENEKTIDLHLGNLSIYRFCSEDKFDSLSLHFGEWIESKKLFNWKVVKLECV